MTNSLRSRSPQTVYLLSETETVLGSSIKKRLSSLLTGAAAAGAATASVGAALAALSEKKSRR